VKKSDLYKQITYAKTWQRILYYFINLKISIWKQNEFWVHKLGAQHFAPPVLGLSVQNRLSKPDKRSKNQGPNNFKRSWTVPCPSLQKRSLVLKMIRKKLNTQSSCMTCVHRTQKNQNIWWQMTNWLKSDKKFFQYFSVTFRKGREQVYKKQCGFRSFRNNRRDMIIIDRTGSATASWPLSSADETRRRGSDQRYPTQWLINDEDVVISTIALSRGYPKTSWSPAEILLTFSKFRFV